MSDEVTRSAKADMGKAYDEFADAFSKSDQLPTWQWVGKPAMAELLAPAFADPNNKFLDLGAASGRLEAGLLLPNGVPPENITGVEISPDQVEIAKRRIPGADFLVGDITTVELPDEEYDVAFSHMVFEHLDDEGLLRACKNAFAALKDGGMFVFVVTHPDKMTDVDGNLVTDDGPFETTAPWGGTLLNFRRSVDSTCSIVESAGFEVESVEDHPFPPPPEGLSEDEREAYMVAYSKYSRYPAIRLAVRARKL